MLTIGYSVGLYALLGFFGTVDFSVGELLECILSPINNQYWFITSYLGLYVLSPYLNKALDSLSEQELKRLCLLFFVGFSLIPSVVVFEPAQDFFDPRSGKSLVWFVVLYCFVFFFKKYWMDRIAEVRPWRILLVFLLSILGLLGSYFVFRWVSLQAGLAGEGQMRLYFDSSAFVLLASFSAFVLALRLSPSFAQGSNFLRRLIVFASSSTLGVYLLHEQPAFKEVLWGAVDRCFLQWVPVHSAAVLLVAFFVFLFACLIETARRGFSRKLFTSSEKERRRT